MDCLVIDLTHGGVKIAISLVKTKRYDTIYAYDIYKTLNPIDKKMLDVYGVKVIDLETINKNIKNLTVVSPIHLPLSEEDIKKEINNPNINYTFLNHHEAVSLILNEWCEKYPEILKIEVTGVKGKTSSVFMLKEIFNFKNPLILSSLGALLYRDGKKTTLKKNISITPANIKETIDLAYKISNPICKIASGEVESENIVEYGVAIFESSLGVTGIGDIGLLTNIAENYPIAKNRLNAQKAKGQVFRCGLIAIEKETLDEYYPLEKEKFENKINTFSLENSEANVYASNIKYSLNKTTFDVTYTHLKTSTGDEINGSFKIATFAPGHHHVQNALGAITVSLASNISEDKIINGLENYKGIIGRSSKKTVKNSLIIEEINPGINTKAIENSIDMIKDLENYSIIIGGDYGITCEEIDEEKVSNLLDSYDLDLTLTGDVGLNIFNKMDKKHSYVKNYQDAINKNIKKGKNILFIYRSNYKELNKR